jgi:hypothetical protein
VRRSQTAHLGRSGGSLLLAGLVTGAVLVAGCSHTVHGNPVASPETGGTEPAFPTRRPTVPQPTPQSPAPPGPTAPAGTIPLPPDDNG